MNNKKSNVMEKIKGLGGYLRFGSIHARLITAFLGLSLIPVFITGFISYSQSNYAITSKIQAYSNQVITQLAVNLGAELKSYNSLVNEICSSSEVQENLVSWSEFNQTEQFNAKTSINQMFASKLQRSGSIRTAGIITETGDFLAYGDGWGDVSTIFGDAGKTESILNEIKEQSKSAWYHVTISLRTTNSTLEEKVMLIGKSINNIHNGKRIGTLVMTIRDSALSKLFENVNLGSGATVFVIDSKGTVISNKENKGTGELYPDKKFIAEIGKIKTMKPWISPVVVNGIKQLAAVSRLDENIDWYVTALIPYKYLNQESNRILSTVILVAVSFLILSIVLSFVTVSSISQPLGTLTDLMRKARKGKLTVEIHDKSKDEIGEVSANFNDMLSNIRNLILKVNSSSQRVFDNSNRVAASSEQYNHSAGEIASNIEEIAKGAASQAEDVWKGVEYIESLSKEIAAVADDMGNVQNYASNTRQLCEEALVAVESLNTKAVQTKSVSEKIANDIQLLASHSVEIKKILKIIMSITEQTNLLSLNASIEAARAGHAGRGFAVVAEEIKKLADQSKDSALMISDIITNIQRETENTVKVAYSADGIMSQQMEAVSKTDEAFKSVLHAMYGILKGMENMGLSVNSIVNMKENAVNTIREVAVIAQQSAATSQEAAAKIEEQRAGAEELSELAKDLNTMAEELHTVVKQFEI